MEQHCKLQIKNCYLICWLSFRGDIWPIFLVLQLTQVNVNNVDNNPCWQVSFHPLKENFHPLKEKQLDAGEVEKDKPIEVSMNLLLFLLVVPCLPDDQVNWLMLVLIKCSWSCPLRMLMLSPCLDSCLYFSGCVLFLCWAGHSCQVRSISLRLVF